MLVPFLVAESAAHWLQGEDRDRGRDRAGGVRDWEVLAQLEDNGWQLPLETPGK